MAKDRKNDKHSKLHSAIFNGKETEYPFTGKLLYNKKKGKYLCAVCGNVLFDSSTKFDSGSGWPSFNFPVNVEAVKLTQDYSYGMNRLEVSCAKCGNHLGHVFDDVPDQPTGMRFCVESKSLDFKED